MTAACITLLHESQCPIWPWQQAGEPGLLVEAFPAAQLCHWDMDFEGYNGDGPEAVSKRSRIVTSLSEVIEISDAPLRGKMEDSADALDAVLCAFAAISVSINQPRRSWMSSDEGEIAVHERIDRKRNVNAATSLDWEFTV